MRPRRNLFPYVSPFARDKFTIIVDKGEIILLYRKWRTYKGDGRQLLIHSRYVTMDLRIKNRHCSVKIKLIGLSV